MAADRQDLRGRTALVSGAASDIGAAVCAALLACGARVRATDLPGERLDSLPDRLTGTQAGAGELEVVAADLTDPAAAARVAAEPADLLAAGARVAGIGGVA